MTHEEEVSRAEIKTRSVTRKVAVSIYRLCVEPVSSEVKAVKDKFASSRYRQV